VRPTFRERRRLDETTDQIEAISTRLVNVKPESANSDLWDVYEWEQR